MRLQLEVIVPRSAEPHIVHAVLTEAAQARQGLTLLTPQLFAVDVDLVKVTEMVPDEQVVRHLEY
jgi:hypothetical protein